MLYKCDHCDYTTKRIRDLTRHVNRKNPCFNKNKEKVCNLEEKPNNNPVQPNNNPVHSYVTIDNKVKLQCCKCNKILSSNQKLKSHEDKCDGLDPKQCRICLKLFTTQQGKWKHKKHVICSPPTQTNNQTINNNNNNNTYNNNTYNINIVRTDFDKITNEDIQKMVSRIAKEEYIKMVNKNIIIGKYVIPRTVEHIYFNDNFPEMQVLKKERRNDKMIEVYIGDGKWEKRLMNDVYKEIIGRVENFNSEYFKYIEDKYKDVKVGSAKWKHIVRPIKTYGNTMLWYDGFIGDDIENIGVQLNYPDEDDDTEKERDKKNKEMEQLVGEKVYDESKLLEQAQRQLLEQ